MCYLTEALQGVPLATRMTLNRINVFQINDMEINVIIHTSKLTGKMNILFGLLKLEMLLQLLMVPCLFCRLLAECKLLIGVS